MTLKVTDNQYGPLS